MGDYDFDPRQAPSIFLKLKEKGDKVLIRLASSPFREPKVWKENERKPLDSELMLKLTKAQWLAMYREPEFNVTEIFHWVVWDRESSQAKIFSGTPGIYKSIKKYAEMPDWGDPIGYDFQIERTEAPGAGYYEVTGIPTKEPLEDKEQKATEAMVITLKEKLVAARKLSEAQVDYDPDKEPEAESETSPTKNDKSDDIVIEDLGGEPINLDDIPF